MIVVLPQPGQRHRDANGVAAWPQSQLVSGCFIGGILHRNRFIINIPGRGYRFVASIKVPGDEN